MKQYSVFVLLAAVILVGSVAVSQENPPMPAPGPMQGQWQRMIERMGLSDEQRKQIDELRFDMAKQALAHQAKVKTARLELAQLFKADTPDKVAIEKKMTEVSQLETQGRLQFINHWFSVNKLLNPDQQKLWKLMLGRHWMQQRLNRGGGMGAPPMMRDRLRRFQQQPPMGPLR